VAHKIQTPGNHRNKKEYEIFLVIPFSVIVGSNLSEVPTFRPERPTGGVDVTAKDKRKKKNVKMRLKLRGLLNKYRVAGRYSVNVTGCSVTNVLKHSDNDNVSVLYIPLECFTIRL
jgi:hypothetical protein